MARVERMQSVLVALAALAGIGIGVTAPQVGAFGEHLVLPALLLMLAAIFVQLDAAAVGQVRRAKSLVAASLVLNFVFTPALAWALGAGLLGGQPDLRIGLLLLVTPCTDWYLVFTAIARGHTGIAAALLPVNLVLQVLLLPLYVLLLGGEAAMVDPAALAQAVLLVLGIPLLAVLGLRRLAPSAAQSRIESSAGVVVVPLLCLAVVAMFAWQAPVVIDHAAQLVLLLVPLLIFFAVLPAVVTVVSGALRLPAAQRVTLTMTTTARNSPIALSIAVAAFPDRPLIAVALVIGPLLELPVLAVLAQIVRARPGSPTGSGSAP